MPDYRHDPLLNYNANLLKQAGTEQYTTGRQTQQQGQDLFGQGVQGLQPVYDYFKKLMSGDTTTEMQAIQPEADVIGQQFDQVRSMVADQPRGGGKTSTLAELPVEQIRAISNLLAQARNSGAQGLFDTASKYIGAGAQETAQGTSEAGQGESVAGQSANIAMGGRAQDIGSSFRANFLSSFGSDLAGSISNLLI